MVMPSPAPSLPSQPHHWYDVTPLRVVALTTSLTAVAVYQALHLFALTDTDIWWRLRTGLWILENHGIPRTGLFSQYSALPWIDSSWLFDLWAAAAYRPFGLRGLPVLLMLLQVAVALAFFLLAGGSAKRFWPAVILGSIAQLCLAPLHPRPALLSIVFLAVELMLLLRARHTGDLRALFWLPPLFVLWANVDRQFSYGLLALGLFCLAIVIEQLCRASGVAWFETGLPGLPLSRLAATAVATLLATFVNPCGYRLHQLIGQSALSSATDRYFRELHAMRFRQPQDYLLMLLVMFAFFSLGRRRSRDLFLILLLIVAAVIASRFQRDSWLAAVVAVAVVGDWLSGIRKNEFAAGKTQAWRVETLATAALVATVAIVLTFLLPANTTLQSSLANNFPTRAADYIRQSRLPQPLLNSYPWGGFLTWYLPDYPVAIDGRSDLYGADINTAYFRLIQAEVPLDSHPAFAQARTILLEANSPMAAALSSLPGYRVVYRDDQAIVLVPQQ